MLVRSRTATFATLILVLGVTGLAQAQVPTRIPFQGLLLDDVGDPVDAAVDLDFALFDGLTGGTLLWSESHAGVTVVSGVYGVELGSTTPLSQSVLAGGSAFLEITVDGETMTPRQQLLSVPYALVSEQVGSVAALPLEQILASFSFDGQPPSNFDPEEGTGDADGDGVPNFIDPDNDDDGLLDGEEVAAGSSINIVTPRVSAVSPPSIPSYVPVTLTVSGQNLDDVTSVAFGAEAPTPLGLTEGGFAIDVLVETQATSLTVDVVAANGEASQSAPVAIQAIAPTITSVAPPNALTQVPFVVTIEGTGFHPAVVLEIDDVVIPTTSISPTTITADYVVADSGTLLVRVTHPNGTQVETGWTPAEPLVFITQTQYDGDLGGITGANAICQAEADAAGAVGVFAAWLSTSLASGTSSSPATTFDTLGGGPYTLSTGGVVAQDWPDLTDGTIGAGGIRRDAEGNALLGFVWTGTNADGTAKATPAETCNEWTSNGSGATGVAGSAIQTTGDWTDAVSAASCAGAFRLYCFQQ